MQAAPAARSGSTAGCATLLQPPHLSPCSQNCASEFSNTLSSSRLRQRQLRGVRNDTVGASEAAGRPADPKRTSTSRS